MRLLGYCVQVYTGEEQSLKSSPGHLKPELVTMPYTAVGQRRDKQRAEAGKEERQRNGGNKTLGLVPGLLELGFSINT